MLWKSGIFIVSPVYFSAVHGIPGLLGALSVGVLGTQAVDPTLPREGLMRGAGGSLLGRQLLACVVAFAWAGVVSGLLLWVTQSWRSKIRGEALGGLDKFDHALEAASVEEREPMTLNTE